MRLEGRRAGAGTLFVDSLTEEVVLQIKADERGVTQVSFRLYDCEGCVVASSEGLQTFSDGVEIRDARDELLLLVPAAAGNIVYRLYSRRGTLLTCSDGERTQLFRGIRVDATKALARNPLRPIAP